MPYNLLSSMAMHISSIFKKNLFDDMIFYVNMGENLLGGYFPSVFHRTIYKMWGSSSERLYFLVVRGAQLCGCDG